MRFLETRSFRTALVAAALTLIPVTGWSAAPLTLLQTIPIPGIAGGDFDHFAVDRAGNRLFVAAEVHRSIETFDLSTGAWQRSLGGVRTPHTIAFSAALRELIVADGGDSSVKIFDATGRTLVARIPLAGPPDAGLYDAANQLFYIGNGGRPAKRADSTISVISLRSRREIARIRVPANNLESMAIDRARGVLYVNMRDKDRIGIVDLKGNAFVRSFSVRGMHLNTPMQYDAADHRLIVAGRKPGRLVAIDTDTRRAVAIVKSVETVDEMSYDAAHHRVYVSGASGLDVYRQDGPDRYRLLGSYDTLGGKTSTLVPSLGEFFVVHTRAGKIQAGLQLYRVND